MKSGRLGLIVVVLLLCLSAGAIATSKPELVEAVAVETGLTQDQAERALDAFLAKIEADLLAGKEVRMDGFGVFATRARAGGTDIFFTPSETLLAALDARQGAREAFLMPIEDVFSIEGRGTVVTGRIESGIVEVGDEVELVGVRDTVKTTVAGIEMFRKLLDRAEAGDNVGLVLRGTKKEDVARGQVLAAPGSIAAHTRFRGETRILSKNDGGRSTPFFAGYRPQFYFRTTDVAGTVELPEGTAMVMPGDAAILEVTLVTPMALAVGTPFAIREGGRTVGAGTVTEILE